MTTFEVEINSLTKISQQEGGCIEISQVNLGLLDDNGQLKTEVIHFCESNDVQKVIEWATRMTS